MIRVPLAHQVTTPNHPLTALVITLVQSHTEVQCEWHAGLTGAGRGSEDLRVLISSCSQAALWWRGRAKAGI